jgi:hypothetical protein
VEAAVPAVAPAPTFEPATEQAAPVATAAVEPVAVVETVAAAEPAPLPVAVPEGKTAPAPADLSATLQQVGLVMIETAASRGGEPIVVEQPRLGRKPKAVTVVASEPLQMVETKRD